MFTSVIMSDMFVDTVSLFFFIHLVHFVSIQYIVKVVFVLLVWNEFICLVSNDIESLLSKILLWPELYDSQSNVPE